MDGTRTAEWKLTRNSLPPEGVVVETLSEGGLQTTLKRSGSLWFIPNGSMYVYYTPMFWRDEAVSNDD